MLEDYWKLITTVTAINCPPVTGTAAEPLRTAKVRSNCPALPVAAAQAEGDDPVDRLQGKVDVVTADIGVREDDGTITFPANVTVLPVKVPPAI